MNAFAILFAFGAFATANAGLLPVVASRSVVSPLAAGAIVVPRGSGFEGQYIPDNLEKLYDDGSYRPELRAQPLSASPYGLVPSGSGLEGAYVHDNTEKLFDDGSYKPQLRAVPLAPSPYGLVPAGSGLEGQYVQDINEKLYDDGSYKPDLEAVLAVKHLIV
ncbi:uncharacterized protein LOC123308592 [Coccinella septempunctata]|uniref:uncharacterized protein LOC123308592 n=1 Tax=Coccinella septempunctata TaxID=41139 RepID=UPI001D079BE4|nr:uncharacterized protein LOC123308592 [Coccinella septempunctata]